MSLFARVFAALRDTAAVAALLVLITPCAAEAGEGALSGSFAVGSDLTFRGVSQTMGDYAVDSSVDLSLPSGLYAYVWGSNVDFVPPGEPDDGATHEIDLAIGYARDITDNWAIDVALVRYLFPGMVSDVNYDFNEIMATVGYADTYTATVAYSSDVDGTGSKSMFYRLGANLDLQAGTALEVNVGHYDLVNAYDHAYSYAEVGLRRSFDNTEIAISYTDTFGSAEQIYFEQTTGQRLILSLQVNW